MMHDNTGKLFDDGNTDMKSGVIDGNHEGGSESKRMLLRYLGFMMYRLGSTDVLK